MAITRGATVTQWTDSATPIGPSFSHTVDSGTDLLIVAFGSEGDLTISSPLWNTSEALTLIGSVTTSSSGGDVRVWLYGIVSPTATTANISFSVAGGGDNAWAVAANYTGTITSSVADATNLINSVDNSNNPATTVALSGTTTSNAALVVAGTFRGGDGDPATVTGAGTFQVYTNATGTSNTTDTSYCYADDVDGGTGSTVSPTIDWTGTASDECVGVFAELLEATGDTNINAGVDALAITTYAAKAQLAPRVWLNSSQTKTGADEMTVTSWTTDGTSITFTDPSGGQTGSLYLGVEEPRNGTLGWIAVTVTASGTTVNASYDALILTEYPATLTLDVGVSASVDAMTLTEYQASIALDVGISASVSSLTLTEYPASLAYDVGVSAGVSALTLTEYPASIANDVGISASVSSLSLTEYAASVEIGYNIAAGLASLTLTEYPASIAVDVGVSASVSALTLTEYAATVSYGVTVDAAAASLSLIEYPVTLTYDVSVNVGLSSLTLTTYPVTFSSDVAVSAGVASLTLTEYAASVANDVAISAGVDSLTITPYAATISTAGDTNISAGSGGPDPDQYTFRGQKQAAILEDDQTVITAVISEFLQRVA